MNDIGIKRLLLSIVAKAMDETMIIDIAAENPLETLKRSGNYY
jgi:hypothetical protein